MTTDLYLLAEMVICAFIIGMIAGVLGTSLMVMALENKVNRA